MGDAPAVSRERWEELYRGRFPHVYRALVATLRDGEAAKDALHDAFMEGLRRPPARDENLTGWLFRVALRRARRGPLRAPWARLADIAFASVTTTDETARVLDRIEVGELLAQLTPRQRAMVVAQYYLGLDADEIANAFGVRPGTVRATVSQALARLRKGEAGGA
jgi:RNA polymerase sigma-70 factor (ECF subfamily)